MNNFWVVNVTGLVPKNSFQEYAIRIEKYSAILTQKNKLFRDPPPALLLVSL